MKFLKILAMSLLSFLLFLSLSVFGLMFMLNSTILNPDFVTTQLDNLDASSLTEEIINEEISRGEFPEELGTAIVNTVTKLEPMVKEQVGAATHSIYDYLLGEKPDPELTSTLRNTVLSQEFAVSLIEELDIPPLAGAFIKEQLTQEIPEEMEPLVEYLDEPLDDTLTELEPWMKEQLSAAADPILDYLLGESQSLSVVIPLEPVKESLGNNLRQAFVQSPPPELSGMSQSALELLFDEIYQAYSAQIPSTFEFDESLLGAETPAEIAEALAEAEMMLEEGREYVAQFQLIYKALIGFMVLLVIGIVLIHHQVKGATRELGIIFATYGVLEYAGIFIAKYFTGKQIADFPLIPPSLQEWLPQFTSDFLAPLEMFSLGLLIGGVVLIVVSFVYKRGEPSD